MSEDDVRNLRLVGGNLCLDFVNTVGGRQGGSNTEHLTDYADLLMWSEHAGILGAAAAQRLAELAAAHTDHAAQAWGRAIDLREAMFRLFDAVARGLPHPDDDLALVNRQLSMAMSRAQLRLVGGEFVWGWADEDALEQMLWPIVRSAADLLTEGEIGLIKECESDTGCGWLFVDTSKNHRRRWCSMDDCGNNAKVRRYRQRQSASSNGR